MCAPAFMAGIAAAGAAGSTAVAGTSMFGMGVAAAQVGSVLSYASTAISLMGSFQQAQAQREQGEYQEGVAQYNARVAENEAVETRNLATEEENIHRRKVAGLLSKQRAQLGAAGVQLTSGSPLQLQENVITLGEADALRIRSNYDSQVASLETKADLTRSQGAFDKVAAENRATGTLLSGASGVLGSGIADKWFTPNSASLSFA